MTFKHRCRHGALAGTLCTFCIGLPAFKPFAETHPETVEAIMGSNQPIPEPDNPNDRAGGQFFQQPIISFVSSTSTRPSERILGFYNPLPPKQK